MPTLTKIDRIKNLAVFYDFRWVTALQPFKRYNLLFGWNGSGKTALSRLFDSLQTGGHESFPSLEYQVTIDGKQYTQKESVSAQVRVFNQDYVSRNIKILEGRTNLILIVGEESQEALTQIQADERALNGIPGDSMNQGRIALRQQATQEKTRLESEINNEFTAIASTISAACSTAGATRTYRRPEASLAFSALSQSSILSEKELESCRVALSQTTEPTLSTLSIPTVIIAKNELALSNAFSHILLRTKTILSTQVQIVAIERLSKNPDLADWAEKGLKLHSAHESANCEFCSQALPPNRLKALGEHFNDADNKLKQEINELQAQIGLVSASIARITPYDEAKLYKQLRAAYTAAVTSLDSAKSSITTTLSDLDNLLLSKRARTTEVVNFNITASFEALAAATGAINNEITQHNDITNNFTTTHSNARNKIETHYLSTIWEKIRARQERIAVLEEQIRIANSGDPNITGDLGIAALERRIAENRAKISSAHKSCDQLNNSLHAYFGRDDLQYKVETDASGAAVGYSLYRADQVAKLVSEGELTAIAFAHFIIRLGEQGFSVKDGIVVIDDPISSLDSGVLFRVCAAIQKHTIGASQLFILTHNMEFFNHMKKWFLNDPGICPKDKESDEQENEQETKERHRFLMIQSQYDTTTHKRVALLTDLDPMLRDYETEYHFLFKKLVNFDAENPPDQSLTIRAIYDYPNLTRKLLECFLAYRVPKSGSMYTRMLGLKDMNSTITSEDIGYVYNFVNSHSHLDTKSGLLQFDPTLTISGRDSIKKALWLIEAADQKHFKAMEKAVKKS